MGLAIKDKHYAKILDAAEKRRVLYLAYSSITSGINLRTYFPGNSREVI